jgi:hypothetical protein
MKTDLFGSDQLGSGGRKYPKANHIQGESPSVLPILPRSYGRSHRLKHSFTALVIDKIVADLDVSRGYEVWRLPTSLASLLLNGFLEHGLRYGVRYLVPWGSGGFEAR